MPYTGKTDAQYTKNKRKDGRGLQLYDLLVRWPEEMNREEESDRKVRELAKT